MGQEYTTRSFKSGNSVAIRVPAALGISPDCEWIIEQVEDGLRLRLKPLASRKIDVSGFAGKAPGVRLAARKDFDERPSTVAAQMAERGSRA